MKRTIATVCTLVVLAGFVPSAGGGTCAPRLLVLSAYPAEIDMLLTGASITETVVVDGRGFYVGTLAGNDVVLALSGIGLVSAGKTARTAIEHFACGDGTAIAGIVFSGVSGGRTNIGDVTIPSVWTDDGETWLEADAEMLAVARAVVEAGGLALARDVPAGDPACLGTDPRAVSTVRMSHAPQILVGGKGISGDPFGGRAFACIPGGGNVFGCHPCRAPQPIPPDVPRFVDGIVPFVDPSFFLDYFRPADPAPGGPYDAVDMETAAVARVALQRAIPFIAFRALSDGNGDPLMLPGFPFQFFAYHQLAADNAATVALAFLRAWASR